MGVRACKCENGRARGRECEVELWVMMGDILRGRAAYLLFSAQAEITVHMLN